MTQNQLHVVVLAGPNGAGKSTTAPALLQGQLGVAEFVNADTLARGLSAFSPEGAAIEAGRIMLRRLHQLAAQQRDFAFETTLASRTFAPRITEWMQTGYAIHLLWRACRSGFGSGDMMCPQQPSVGGIGVGW